MRRNENMRDVTLSVMVVIDLSPTWLSHFNMTPQHDFHAGFSETSVMMYWAGDKVRMDELAYDEKELLKGMRTDHDWYANIDKKVGFAEQKSDEVSRATKALSCAESWQESPCVAPPFSKRPLHGAFRTLCMYMIQVKYHALLFFKSKVFGHCMEHSAPYICI